ncbi:MAG: SIMPL domain-containing protein [Phycisphaerales bacterium]|nr:SIMPL domain-containing protein [Phycisphaerales bacterium]
MQTVISALLGLGMLLGSAGGLVQEGQQAQENRRMQQDDDGQRQVQSQPAPVQIEATSILRVRGEATAAAAPDRATVTIGAVAQGRNAAEAQRSVNRQVENIVRAVRVLDVEDMVLQTQSVSLSPRYDSDRGRREPGAPPVIIGYQASNTVQVRIDEVGMIGRVIDAAMEGGANTISGISFHLRDDSEQRAEALAKAAERAREKARVLSRATGAQITGIVEIAEEGTQAIPFHPRGFGPEMLAARATDPGAQIEAGQIEVRAAVTITYHIKVENGEF